MPLSDREQQILAEIERNLLDEDPDLARRTARSESEPRKALRGGALLFAAGLFVLAVFFYTSAIVFGVLAFGAMVTGLVVIAGGIRSAARSRTRTLDGTRERLLRNAARWEAAARERYEARRREK